MLIRPLDPDHDAQPLYAESHPPLGYPGLWTYLPNGPYRDPAELRDALRIAAASEDPLFFALVPLPAERPAGVASYLRITPEHGVIEIGHIWFGASLRRTIAATEAIYLLAAHAFDDLGYRRLEWKCDSLNQASRRAADRFGLDTRDIIMELGRRKVVVGQEDMILGLAAEMAGARLKED